MTRVLVVDDHPVFRHGIASLLAVSGFEVVGEAAGAHEAVELARRLRPDIVVMDLGLPDGSGVTATEQIVATHPEIRVVVVTLFDDDGTVRSALRAGASGYVVKDASHDEILSVVRAAVLGATVLGSGVRAAAMDGVRPDAVDDGFELSRRERQVAELLEKGLTNRQIAERLGLAGKTVSNLVSAVLAKLGADDRLDAAAIVRAAHRGALPEEIPPAHLFSPEKPGF